MKHNILRFAEMVFSLETLVPRKWVEGKVMKSVEIMVKTAF